MNDINKLFANIQDARQYSQNLLGEIYRLASSGNVDNQKKAVELSANLGRALIHEKQAIDAYVMGVSISLVKNLGESKALTRSAFNALSPRRRLQFVQSGGQIQD
jgi:hypothetical protein